MSAWTMTIRKSKVIIIQSINILKHFWKINSKIINKNKKQEMIELKISFYLMQI